jgi:hypothetical protein
MAVKFSPKDAVKLIGKLRQLLSSNYEEWEEGVGGWKGWEAEEDQEIEFVWLAPAFFVII